MQDVIEETKTIVQVNTNEQFYKKRQMDSFRALGTNPSDWRPAKIIGVTPMGFLFEIPSGYGLAQPIFLVEPSEKRIYESILKSANAARMLGARLQFDDMCMLCGHPIKNAFPILNDTKKLVIYVGCECVNSFMGAGYVLKEVKKFKDNQIRKEFRDWQPKAIERCNEFKDTSDAWCIKNNRLQYWAWKLQKIIAKTDADTTTSRKLTNLMKKAEKKFKENL